MISSYIFTDYSTDHAPETDVKPTNTLLEVLVPLDTARSATERTNIHPHAAEILVPHPTPEIEGVTGWQFLVGSRGYLASNAGTFMVCVSS